MDNFRVQGIGIIQSKLKWKQRLRVLFGKSITEQPMEVSAPFENVIINGTHLITPSVKPTPTGYIKKAEINDEEARIIYNWFIGSDRQKTGTEYAVARKLVEFFEF